MRYLSCWIVTGLLVLGGIAFAAESGNPQIPNPGFEEGQAEGGKFIPRGWTAPPEGCEAVEPGFDSPRGVLVQGNGDNDAAWISDPVSVQPGTWYEFSFWGKKAPETQGGSAVSGPTFANQDLRLENDWKRYAVVFRVPENQTEARFRLGQWHAKGTLYFDAADLVPVQPVYTRRDGLVFGQGERVMDTAYTALHDLDAPGGNGCRFMQSSTAGFNSNRLIFGTQSQVTYRHEIPGNRLVEASVEVNLNYRTAGIGRVSARSDKADWTELGAFSELNTHTLTVPEALRPAAWLEVRLEGVADDQGCNFQVDQYRLQGALEKPLPAMEGQTHFLRVSHTDPSARVAIEQVGDPKPGVDTELVMSVENPGAEKSLFTARLDTTGPKTQDAFTRRFTVNAGETATVRIPYFVSETGKHRLDMQVFRSREENVFRGEMPLDVPFLYTADFGEQIDSGREGTVWWCPATYKVSQSRPVPRRQGHAVVLSAARGEFEPAQVVLRPERAVSGLTVAVEALRGPEGAEIPAGAVQVKQVEYVYVHRPSDAWGCVDWWPDPLPLVEEPLTLESGRNYPFWIVVQVPRDAGAGTYKGTVRFQSEDWNVQVPLQLRVYDFTIPQRSSVRSGFGFSPGLLRQYHHLESKEEVDQVTDLYFQSFRDHRISPYDPTLLHPIQYKLNDSYTFDFSDFDQAGQRYFDEFGFNGLRLDLEGMGGGTFHSRQKGRIGPYEQGTPEHERLFREYASTIEKHLQEKGWLDKAYVYWFDEPDPKDYEFVAEGMEMIKRNAPGLKRFLTEQPEPELLGHVDIWCAILDQYDPEGAKERQKLGEEFWWYVCTGPKQPYPGLFIDHPAVDMRMWLWMTYRFNLQGCLVWQSNYWTSGAAFPSPKLQDPWSDPMSYVSGYDNPPGYIGYWGNGDGRFMYPPKNWTDGKKRITGPVDSIRWEMLREGFEDYEYFKLVENALKDGNLAAPQREKAEELLWIPTSIIGSMTEYTKDPTPLYERREALARFLEEIKTK